MAKIIIACSKKPLAAFIETALADFDSECRIAVDAVHLQELLAESKPDVLLFDSAFSSSSESLELLEDLRHNNPALPIVGIFEPFGENLDEIRQILSSENTLTLPFGRDDLHECLIQATGRDLIKKRVVQEIEEGEKMSEPQDIPVTIVELTEIVEEGLPLDEIPGLEDGKMSESFLEVDSASVEIMQAEPEGELSDDLDLDDFNDTLDDLESGSAESAEVETDADKVSDVGPNVDDDTVVEESLEVATEAENIIESSSEEDSSEFVAGDVDALLADDEFTEVEIPERPENDDPVLAELKSAGLTAENEMVEVKSEAASLPTEELDGEIDFCEDDLSDIDDLLDEISKGEDAVAESLPEPEFKDSEKDDVVKDTEVEFSELVVPRVDAEDLLSGVSEGQQKEFSNDVMAPLENDIELPEDYLLEEEMPDFTGEPEPEPEPASGTQLTTSSSLELESEEPEICAEPISQDFSRQIESMTQEWSKQLLQSTYASMDKMIKAIGDLAPTIVDQVAREVIPPLAEKVIKAEIARLEKTLEIEEEQEEETNT